MIRISKEQIEKRKISIDFSRFSYVIYLSGETRGSASKIESVAAFDVYNHHGISIYHDHAIVAEGSNASVPTSHHGALSMAIDWIQENASCNLYILIMDSLNMVPFQMNEWWNIKNGPYTDFAFSNLERLKEMDGWKIVVDWIQSDSNPAIKWLRGADKKLQRESLVDEVKRLRSLLEANGINYSLQAEKD